MEENSQNKLSFVYHPSKLKPRRQDEVVKELEAYKSLCERRICELSPGHPLPIQHSHLEKALPIKQTQLEIEDLKDQIKGIQREKQTLEEALKIEMLSSEKQRNYINILKEALKTRIDTEMITVSECKDVTDTYMEITNLKKEREQLVKENESYEVRVEEVEKKLFEAEKATAKLVQENNELKEDNNKLKNDLQNLIKALEDCKEIISKSKKDKINLDVKVEELNRYNEQLKKALEEAQALSKEQEQEHEKHIKELQIEKIRIENELQTELQNLNKEFERRSVEFIKLLDQQEVTNPNEQSLLKKYEVLIANNTNMKDNYFALTQTLNEIQGELEKVKTEKAKLEFLLNKGKEIDVENSQGYGTVATDRELMLLREEANTKTKEAEKLKEELLNVKEQLIITYDEMHKCKEDAKESNEELREYKEVCEKMKKELMIIEELNKVVENLGGENERLREEVYSKENDIDQCKFELISLKSKLDERIGLIHSLENDLRGREKELGDVIKDNKELNNKLTQTTQLLEESKRKELNIERKYKEQLEKNNTVITNFNQLKLELGTLQTQHIGLEVNMNTYKEKDEENIELIEKQRAVIETIKESLNLCIEVIKTFSIQFNYTQSSVIRDNASRRFRDIMLLYNDIEVNHSLLGLDNAIKTVVECFKAAFEEISSFNKLLIDTRKELKDTLRQVELEKGKTEILEDNIKTVKEKEKLLELEVESAQSREQDIVNELRDLCLQNNKLKELKIQNEQLLKEQEKHKAQIRNLLDTKMKLEVEIHQRDVTTNKDLIVIESHRESIKQLNEEKRHLEFVIDQAMKAIPKVEVRKSIAELRKVQAEYYQQVKEKTRLNNTLSNTNNTSLHQELFLIEENMRNLKRELLIQESNLKDIQVNKENYSDTLNKKKEQAKSKDNTLCEAGTCIKREEEFPIMRAYLARTMMSTKFSTIN